MGQNGAHVGQAARKSAPIGPVGHKGGMGKNEHVQIAKQPVEVEHRAPVGITHARDGALGIRM